MCIYSTVIDVQIVAKLVRGIFCFRRLDRARVLHSQNARLGASLNLAHTRLSKC